jgi:two-component system nitrate/nitrite sensor histidine kinase NarX
MGKSSLESKNVENENTYRNIFDAITDGLIICDLETGIIVEANSAACKMHGYPQNEFIGQPISLIIHPDYQNIFNKKFQTFQSGGLFEIQAKHKCKNGSTLYAEWHGTASTYQNRHCLVCIIHNITFRIQEEQLLREHVETRTLEQATLLKISHTLASTLELQPGLILDQLHEIIEYNHGGLFGLHDSTIVTLAMRGTPLLEQSKPIHIHIRGPEILTTLFNEHKPIRIANLWSDNPQAQFLRSLLVGDAAVLLEGMQSWMWVPLAVKGRIVGGIGIAETRKNYYTAHHADLALSVANQAAVTMINAELYGNAQALAVLEERQRLARNLHDAINQSLFSAGLIAEVLPRLWDRDQDEARRSLEDLRRLTRGAQAEMRALLAELRPSTLTDADLGDLIRLLGNAHSGRTNTDVVVNVVENVILPAEVQVAFYRICQEALFNIAKHAKAKQVQINLEQKGALFELSIHDDGKGFNPGQTISGHYGLNIMQERAKAAGVELLLTSQPGKGTTVVIKWVITPTKEDQ